MPLVPLHATEEQRPANSLGNQAANGTVLLDIFSSGNE